MGIVEVGVQLIALSLILLLKWEKRKAKDKCSIHLDVINLIIEL